MRIGARHDCFAGLDRLAQRIQHGTLEFRQLIEEEDAEMRQRHLARLDAQSASRERGHRGGVMRIAKWPAPRNRTAGKFTGQRLNHRNLERFARIERRQQCGQALRQHRLSRTGRSDHEQVVAAGRGDFERAFRSLLSFDIAQVRRVRRVLCELGSRPIQDLHTFHMVDERDERRCCDDLDAAGPGCFGT
jgi:hypothetical protein